MSGGLVDEWRRCTPQALIKWARARGSGVTDEETLRVAEGIVRDVRARGDAALRDWSQRLGDLDAESPMIVERPQLRRALDALPREDRAVLERVRDRIAAFAEAQRRSITDASLAIPGGSARQCVRPLSAAGCYAPGGRYPLPSSVLMTAVTARVAGVRDVIVAAPRPVPVTLAAAALADADELLTVGGAQAIAALAFGTESVPRCDVVVGPGNRWVTAAKRLVSGAVRIDMLAGPSELLLIADASADPRRVAADLVAQAEHDVDAVPMLVLLDTSMEAPVRAAIDELLETIETAETARRAFANGFVVHAQSLEEAIAISDDVAPEHLQLSIASARTVADRFTRYGGLFVGEDAAEVLGDYGAGPNHTLPTAGSARWTGGLSVFDFLALRTTLEIDDPIAARGMAEDASALARMEGLAGHRIAASLRASGS